ncbi:GTPase Era [Helicobacter turcicus]|uniref:GTPase Era n=1 Tax=Helicobacter turcicus TaxID=2867412 RepID=A0ABS7JN24_9HELI|nr:GTPase Era [Helicobacter turcicus]MBX7490782.1 GTPase Era [Helicobacter turcicus]MBX7545609.1 GTPase Era [Helicobacter turcicus]
MENTKAGFVAVLGRPNAGKSTFLNTLLGEKLALVSHKANATRKRMHLVLTEGDTQIVFVDTPGIHKQEKLLNQYMLKEAMQALRDCDFLLFLAPVSDKISYYEEFLEMVQNKKHILLLTKTDSVSKDMLFRAISKYEKFKDFYEALIPVSIKDLGSLKCVIEMLVKFMPKNPYYYDPEILSPNTTKEIAKELIREAVFENLSDELPYESDVQITFYREKPNIHHIKATIVVHKESQKGMVIGRGGASLKRIGKEARLSIENFVHQKVFLELFVKVVPSWSKERESLKKMGYNFEY